MQVITYGQFEIDTAKLPATTIHALLKRGIAHVLGNEAASKVVGLAETAAKAGNPMTDEQKASAKLDAQMALLAAMESGELGVSNRGPKQDPVEAAANAIAKREVLDVLRDANPPIKAPKGDAKVRFQDGKEFTLSEMVGRRLANPTHGDRIRREAAKHVAELDKKAKKMRQAAANADSATADALDL